MKVKHGDEEASLIVLQALSMTVGMVIGLTTFSLMHQKQFDLTSFAPYIYVIVFSTGMFGIVMLCVNSIYTEEGDPKMNLGDLNFLFCMIGVIIFSLFLMYDIQLIVGGQAALYKFDLESYVLGALALYIDVINIFAILLQLFS